MSLPPGTFVNAGAGVKANLLLFFTRGTPTEQIWYYDLSGVKVGKKNPLTVGHFEEFFRLLPERTDSERSWTVSRQEIGAKSFDLQAVNPHAKRGVGEGGACQTKPAPPRCVKMGTRWMRGRS